MDFTFSDSELRFQDDVKNFLRKHLPSDYSDKSFIGDITQEQKLEIASSLRKLLSERNWLT